MAVKQSTTGIPTKSATCKIAIAAAQCRQFKKKIAVHCIPNGMLFGAFNK
jgi:hypothetical protein